MTTKCPHKNAMARLTAALNECDSLTLKDRRDALEGVKKGICGRHCATVCKLFVTDLTEGQRWLLK